jgi:acetolactate synthase-1/2/3 large subunit
MKTGEPLHRLSEELEFEAKDTNLEVGELIVRHLEQLEVEYVFGVPGGAVEPFFNAMAKSQRQGLLLPVAARHETSAAYMAQGYARQTGKLGVCVATTGPGACNLVTGVASAYLDEVPLLVITGLNTPLTNARAAFQDSSMGGVDTVALFNACTRYNALVSRAEQLERELYAALSIAYAEQKGPVHLAIPVDILSADSKQLAPTVRMPMLGELSHPLDFGRCHALQSLIAQSTHYVLVIGESCFEAIDEIIRFAETRNVLFVCLPAAKGFIDPGHPLFRGVFGFAGHFHARETLLDTELDFILVLGSALSEWDTAKWDEVIFNERLIHIDPVLAHHTYTPMAKMHIRCDIKALFHFLNTDQENKIIDLASGDGTELLDAQKRKALQPRYPQCDAKKQKIHPGELMQVLGKIVPHNSRFFIDAGNSMSWGLHYLNPIFDETRRDPCWFHISMRFAAMGWGIGNAIGAAMGNRNALTFCVTGDGSYLMNGQEITVAIEQRLPVIFIILNDSQLGMVKHGQRMANAESVSNQLPPIDFAANAIAMGALGIRCENISDLLNIDFDNIVKRTMPTLIDVIIDGECEPPMHFEMHNPNGVAYV